MNADGKDQKAPTGRPPDSNLVKITLDGQVREIAEGVYKVQELKARYGVPPDYELDEVVRGEFKHLNDERSIHIMGGEVFISHVRQGSSS